MEVPAIRLGADQGVGLGEWQFGRADNGRKGGRDLCLGRKRLLQAWFVGGAKDRVNEANKYG